MYANIYNTQCKIPPLKKKLQKRGVPSKLESLTAGDSGVGGGGRDQSSMTFDAENEVWSTCFVVNIIQSSWFLGSYEVWHT